MSTKPKKPRAKVLSAYRTFERPNAMVDNIVKNLPAAGHGQGFAEAARESSSALSQAKGRHKPNLRSL